ncbi:hypothetical protein ABZ816_33905 [Actinosynnema sp. NPDC047251]|uniref:Putative membrane protein n=1 Tax=Saccharothrix espanaensis (strain ATCC 51144 / DSM 44229 / JCM 9112 / NBRC 15066 / NRRL 15764) TaxID=1179773 RepID=K0K6J0_SACES|nr:hypothetical protein [Saccharothrix espanaensis]CCH33112.1 putative membrane protein [Saccharothrix espanaensis DSM 44229]
MTGLMTASADVLSAEQLPLLQLGFTAWVVLAAATGVALAVVLLSRRLQARDQRAGVTVTFDGDRTVRSFRFTLTVRGHHVEIAHGPGTGPAYEIRKTGPTTAELTRPNGHPLRLEHDVPVRLGEGIWLKYVDNGRGAQDDELL